MERASVLQNTQIAAEAVPGTPVAANRRLQTLSISTSFDIPTEQFTPKGFLFPTASWSQGETTKLQAEGIVDYNETGILLAAVINRPETTDNLDGTFTHVFTPPSTAAANPVTYSIETGDTVRAQQCCYGLFTSASFDLSTKECKVTGEGFARPAVEGVVMTSAGLIEVEANPVIPKQWTTYISRDADIESLVLLSRNFKAGFNLGGRYKPVQTLNAAEESFSSHVTTAPELTGTIMAQTDAQGMSLLPDLRAGKTVYLRAEAVGAAIGTGDESNRLIIDICTKPSGAGAPADEDGVHVMEWTLAGVHDATRGHAFQVTLVNTTESYA